MYYLIQFFDIIVYWILYYPYYYNFKLNTLNEIHTFFNETVLYVAIEQNNVDICKLLFSKPNIDTNLLHVLFILYFNKV